MANNIDVLNPILSAVSYGMEGKIILIHSNERKLGKTFQATRFPRPYYLRFEQGLNAIPNIPYAPLTKWADFKRVNKQLTDEKLYEKLREKYSTIIIDTTDVAIKWCKKYVCGLQGVERINDGNNGFGLWDEYENEWFFEFNKLLRSGFCILIIAHSEERKVIDPITKEEYMQLYPKGDKRTIDLIVDAADMIGYVRSNGFDKDGKPLQSSIYFSPCHEFLAGGRFTHLPPIITPFTAENVQQALEQAIKDEEVESGIKSVSYTEQVATSMPVDLTYEEAMEKVKPLFASMNKQFGKDKTLKVVEKYLGEGVKISDTTDKQLEQVLMIIDDFEDLLE